MDSPRGSLKLGGLVLKGSTFPLQSSVLPAEAEPTWWFRKTWSQKLRVWAICSQTGAQVRVTWWAVNKNWSDSVGLGRSLGTGLSQVPGTCCCPGTTLGKRLICTESCTQQTPCVHCTVTHVPHGHIVGHPVLRTKQGPIVQSEKQAVRGSDVPEVT